jgi:membrane-bound serine protease (ClpP class)
VTHQRRSPRFPARSAQLILSLLLLVCSMAGIGQGGPGTQPPPTAPGAVSTARQADHVAVITIKGPIDSTTFRSFERRLELADRAGADAVVIDIDTPGGELGAVLGISTAIKSSPIKNTVAWVHPTAYSGGAIIALAARELVISDPATMGDALPIAMSIFGQINSMPEHERQKFLTPIIADLVDSARRSGYDEVLVQGIAARGVELWLVEHTQTRKRLFVTRDEYRLLFGEDPAATSPTLVAAPPSPEGEQPAPAPTDEMLKKLKKRMPRPAPQPAQTPPPSPDDPNRYVPANPKMEPMAGDVTQQQELPTARPQLSARDQGQWRLVEYVASGAGPFVFKTSELRRYGLATEVINTDEELRAFFGAKEILRLDQSWSEGLVAFLTQFPVRGLLVVVFLIGLFVEMTHPGLVLPGFVAAAALLGLLGPPMLINMASWWEIAAIVGGILLIVLEIFVIPGFGVFGIIGLLLLFGGLVGTFLPSGAFFSDSARQRSDMLYGVTTLVLSMASAGVLMYFIAKHFSSIPMLGRLVLQGGIEIDESDRDPMLAAMAPAGSPIKVGMTGRAITSLRPAGQVEINGTVYDVVADIGYIESGQPIRISSVTAFRVGVERA